jgi:high-affinity iron transporter
VLGQYLIAFREVLEAALITSIVLAYLARTGRRGLSRHVWYGVLIATAASVVLGAVVWTVYGELSEVSEQLFEGVAALIAVAVLSTMIYWMATKGKELKAEVEKRVESLTTRGAVLGLVSFAFVAVFREGLETVLFLTPFLVQDSVGTVGGLLLGIVTALALAYAIFFAGMKINIRRFFYFTSILLVLLAGGLAGYGMHELIEYTGSSGWGLLGQPAYNLGIASDNPLHHKGIIGSIFAVMFGYTVSAEWARLIVHIAYLIIALPLVLYVYRKK